ncbi:hypothetical protein [Arcicella lustrica]|uniref:Uncharacterized protein n=1 Tax=Arcicella lustrica TaxID=2984196 RepID=A0ABU5SNK1_9BACT|nr:hypothetical protein [Arcicella sp. DC25W]MEA5428529.1 hypothetical protein [Arcicella sp. DC25W]
MKENKRFDRYELNNSHFYNNVRGDKPEGNKVYQGFLKCKLVHNNMFSVIVPDLIYIMDDEENFSWFQFFSFLPNHLSKFTADEIYGTIFVDIAWGHTLKLTISNEGHIGNLRDSSNLFKSSITGPEDLMDYATGKGKIINNIPYIRLFHHTTPAIKKLIKESSCYKGSVWNYQGTKTLKNISYAYFTSLDEIKQQQDLVMIAMASDGEIPLMIDISKKIIKIPVYREDTTNRTATLCHYIDSSILLSNHIWMHTQDDGSYVYYEICSPYIFRIGLQPTSLLPFDEDIITWNHVTNTSDHIVLGDSTTELGLIAPFDEEYTTHLFKIEPFLDNSTNILKFWFDNMNKDLYTHKKINRPEF